MKSFCAVILLMLLANLTWGKPVASFIMPKGAVQPVPAEECTSTVRSGPCDLASCTQLCQAGYSKDGHGECVGVAPAQKLGAFVNLCTYYLVGVPLAIVFSIALHMKVKGLWMGIALAVIVQLVCLLLITLCTNWEKEVKKAVIRVQGPGDPASNQNVTN
ncbi:hypothetical protein K1719_023773 [Acacia pycnantha]|nr:hypothetical protein K1719_023773 [Acacia pycnantha]